MPFYDRGCDDCGHVVTDVFEPVRCMPPMCPKCSWPMRRVWTSRATGVVGDDIPGGFVGENGFSDREYKEGRTKFYSWSSYHRALAERGKEIRVRHVPVPGSDKSPHTTDWSKGSIDAYTLEAARVLTTRNGTAVGNEPKPEPLHVKWESREVHIDRTGHRVDGPWRPVEEK